MRLRIAIGVLIALIGSVALTANSYLLGSGALHWAGEHDLWQRMSLASGGAVVPWMLAVVPLLFVTVHGNFFARNRQRGLIIVLWLVFFFYNFLMGTSNIAQLRETRVATHRHDVETVEALRDRRSTLRSQLAAVPEHRPAETVQRLLEAEKTSRRWTWTESCTDATATASRAFCDNYRRLEAELEAAKAAAGLNAEIAALDTRIAKAAPTTAANTSADPFVDFAAEITGLAEKWVRVLLAMATPVILEILGASCWKYAASLFGWDLQLAVAPNRRPPTNSGLLGYSGPHTAMQGSVATLPAGTPLPSQIANLTRQRDFADWFLSNCTRLIAEGSLPEVVWYDHYREVCERHNDQPLVVDSFRRLVRKKFGPENVKQINGEVYYLGFLPLVPKEVAA